MELTCLNCAGTFEIDEGGSGSDGGSVECPMCGQAQDFIPRAGIEASAPPPGPSIQEVSTPPPTQDAAPPPETGASSFKKPMQAFSSFARRQVSGPDDLKDDTGSMKQVTRKSYHEDTPYEARIPRIEKKEPSGSIPETSEDDGNGTGLWLVKSPSGLVLEFPSSHLLVNWSAIVENPAPYSISKGGEVWQALADFLEEVRQGNRGTTAFRRIASSMERSQGSSVTVRSVSDSTDRMPAAGTGTPGEGVEIGGQDGGDAPSIPTSPTSGFQFKIRETRAPKSRKWLVVGIVVGVVVLAAGATVALYFTCVF